MGNPSVTSKVNQDYGNKRVQMGAFGGADPSLGRGLQAHSVAARAGAQPGHHARLDRKVELIATRRFEDATVAVRQCRGERGSMFGEDADFVMLPTEAAVIAIRQASTPSSS